MKGNRGFTLIELLVVIAIIGILSSVVLASLNSARTKARDARRIEDVKQIQTALELYHDSNNSYPASMADLVTGGQIPVVPKDPQSNADYKYAALGSGSNCSSYHLGADLETAHNALNNDKDFDSSPAGVSKCTGGGSGFDGTDGTANTYDVQP